MPSSSKSKTVLVWSQSGYPIEVVTLRDSRYWAHSPKVNGVLMLKGNGMTRDIARCTGYNFVGHECSNLPRTANGITMFTSEIMKQLETVSYARLRGKLYKGNAALGVTLAGYKQTRAMVAQNYDRINNKLGLLSRVLGRVADPKAAAKAAANTHLEFIFGVVPLYVDIVSALTSVVQQADQLAYVRGAHKVSLDRDLVISSGGDSIRTQIRGHARMTQACGVRIRDPNVWLLERAGLLNLGTVAWDVVPWSFLVNMFVNINQMVQQVTDFVGLEFDNVTVTRAARYGQWTSSKRSSQSSISFEVDYKTRTVGQLAKPSLQFRLPEVSWGTCAMAASLATQQIGRITKLLPITTKKGH